MYKERERERERERESHKMPQKLTTTACFIQDESSGGRQFRKHVSCFYAQGGNVGVLSFKIASIPFFV